MAENAWKGRRNDRKTVHRGDGQIALQRKLSLARISWENPGPRGVATPRWGGKHEEGRGAERRSKKEHASVRTDHVSSTSTLACEVGVSKGTVIRVKCAGEDAGSSREDTLKNNAGKVQRLSSSRLPPFCQL